MRSKRIVEIIAIISLIVFGQPAFAQAKTDEEVKQTSGKKIYMEHCASCHGEKLEGQPNWRSRKPDGKLPAPPHDEYGHTWHHSDEQLFQITKLGTEAIVGNDYKSDMPGFKDALSDKEIRLVLDFIKSTWPERIRKIQARRNRKADVNE